MFGLLRAGIIIRISTAQPTPTCHDPSSSPACHTVVAALVSKPGGSPVGLPPGFNTVKGCVLKDCIGSRGTNPSLTSVLYVFMPCSVRKMCAMHSSTKHIGAYLHINWLTSIFQSALRVTVDSSGPRPGCSHVAHHSSWRLEGAAAIECC